MALSAATVFECRTTGSDSNGGGFVAGASGTDFSQQDAAQYTFTDLASSNGTNASPVVTSASHNFVAADVGNILQVTAGTNWTAGFYQVVSVSANAATLDKACGSAASLSGGTYAVGGALATPGKAAGAMAGGNKLWIKSGTYSITSASTNVAGGCPSLPGGAAGVMTKAFGYGSARGDGGTMPLLQASGISTFTLLTLAAFSRAENLSLDGASLTSSKGVSGAAGSSVLYRCKIANCTNSAVTGTASCIAILCEATGCSTVAAFGLAMYLYCVAHDNTISGFSFGTGQQLLGCVASNNTGASSDGFATGGGTNAALIGCTAYANGRHGFNLSITGRNEAVDCLAVNNSGYGFTAASVFDDTYLYNCAGYNNTSGLVNSTNVLAVNQIGLVTLTGSPFTNAAGNDFSLNNTAGAGAACRAAGIPGAAAGNQLPGLSTLAYLDVGASQHADSGGGGGFIF
jgi:hypothetical protein